MAKNGNARGSPAGHMVSFCVSAKVKFDSSVSLSQSVLDKTICICVAERLAQFVVIVMKGEVAFDESRALALLSDWYGLTPALDKDRKALLFVYFYSILASVACLGSSAAPANLAARLPLVATENSRPASRAEGRNWAMCFLPVCHV